MLKISLPTDPQDYLIDLLNLYLKHIKATLQHMHLRLIHQNHADDNSSFSAHQIQLLEQQHLINTKCANITLVTEFERKTFDRFCTRVCEQFQKFLIAARQSKYPYSLVAQLNARIRSIVTDMKKSNHIVLSGFLTTINEVVHEFINPMTNDYHGRVYSLESQTILDKVNRSIDADDYAQPKNRVYIHHQSQLLFAKQPTCHHCRTISILEIENLQDNYHTKNRLAEPLFNLLVNRNGYNLKQIDDFRQHISNKEQLRIMRKLRHRHLPEFTIKQSMDQKPNNDQRQSHYIINSQRPYKNSKSLIFKIENSLVDLKTRAALGDHNQLVSMKRVQLEQIIRGDNFDKVWSSVKDELNRKPVEISNSLMLPKIKSRRCYPL